MRAPDFKFSVGGRVIIAGQGTYPPMWARRVGQITGRYDVHDSIPRRRDTFLATTPKESDKPFCTFFLSIFLNSKEEAKQKLGKWLK